MANSISKISTQGKGFLDESGTRFMIRGVALSSNNDQVDLLSSDYSEYMQNYVIPQLEYLNANTIRVYQVDESKDHSIVMSMLAAKNIYVMVGLVNPQVSIDRNNPSYTLALYNRVCTVAKEFCQYDNTLAFSVGNEVVFPGEIYTYANKNASEANQIIVKDALVMKSLIRDLKAYIKTNKLRSVPVGMAMQDGPSNTVASWGGIGTDVVAMFYACGNPEQAADFIGINSYRYVNGKKPGPMNAYDGLANEVANIPVPVFLTESGGFETPPFERDWAIVPQMYTEALLSQNLSGQVAFQFFNKQENMGLFIETPSASANPCPSNGSLEPTKLGGAVNLRRNFGRVSSKVPSMPSPVTTPSACPTKPIFPPLLPCPAPSINITIQNYAPLALVAVQNNVVIAQLPAGTSILPSSTPVIANNTQTLYIQNEQANWEAVCQLAFNNINEGMVISNQVAWGVGVACPIVSQ